ncbi:MAG: rhomboid family intramembrane serine protease [Treponema sp.]|nr:rhomboid family intramembrane serine protease [Treponema sp.]
MTLKNKFFRKPFKYTFFNATIVIALINIAIYSISYIRPELYNYIYQYCGLSVLAIDKYHFYWQFFTYMFVHGSFQHVFLNMLGFVMFGLTIEKAIGSREFLLFYFLCGILSGVLSYLVYKFTNNYYSILIGASGAIYSILFAYAVFFPRSIIYLWWVIPVPAPVMVILYTIIELGSQIFYINSGIAHFTHLFGFLTAYLYFVIRMGIHPIKVWKGLK